MPRRTGHELRRLDDSVGCASMRRASRCWAPPCGPVHPGRSDFGTFLSRQPPSKHLVCVRWADSTRGFRDLVVCGISRLTARRGCCSAIDARECPITCCAIWSSANTSLVLNVGDWMPGFISPTLDCRGTGLGSAHVADPHLTCSPMCSGLWRCRLHSTRAGVPPTMKIHGTNRATHVVRTVANGRTRGDRVVQIAALKRTQYLV
jgi:hypothetical protein